MLARNFGKIPVILAVFCLAFALIMTGCDDGSSSTRRRTDDNGPREPAYLGGRLELNNVQVWHLLCCCDGGGYYTVTGGPWTITSAVHHFHRYGFRYVTGWDEKVVVGNRLSFSIGSPASNLWDIANFFDSYIEDFGIPSEIFNDFEIHGNADAAAISYFRIYSNIFNGTLRRFRSVDGPPYIAESVIYIYVNQNVHISGTGQTICDCVLLWGSCSCGVPCDCGDFRIITGSLTLNLQEGWNSLHFRSEGRYSGGIWESRNSISQGAPERIRWVLEEW